MKRPRGFKEWLSEDTIRPCVVVTIPGHDFLDPIRVEISYEEDEWWSYVHEEIITRRMAIKIARDIAKRANLTMYWIGD